MESSRAHARERWGSKEGVDRWQADPVLELREERSPEQELLEQAQEGREGPCGSIRGGRASSLHGKCMLPNFDSKSTEVEIINDDVEPEK